MVPIRLYPRCVVAVAVTRVTRNGWAAFAVLSALGGNLSVHDAVHLAQCFPQKVHVSVHTALA